MLEVQLLGHLALADAGHRIEAVRNPRLIAFLLLNRGRPLERLRSRSRCGQIERCSGTHESSA